MRTAKFHLKEAGLDYCSKNCTFFMKNLQLEFLFGMNINFMTLRANIKWKIIELSISNSGFPDVQQQ